MLVRRMKELEQKIVLIRIKSDELVEQRRTIVENVTSSLTKSSGELNELKELLQIETEDNDDIQNLEEFTRFLSSFHF